MLERMGIATGIDLWALQDVADEVVRGEIMQRPIEIDRLTATMGYAAVPASYLLHAIRAGERFGLDPREIIVELGQAQGRRRPGGRDHRDRGRAGGGGGTHCVITVVLDDDPTGTQAMSDVSVVLDWSDAEVWKCVEPGDCAVHVLTNSRAHSADEEAGGWSRPRATAARAQSRMPRCVVLRGDSTLRGHLWEEYDALRAIVAPGRAGVPLLLVPALPAAGRVTIDGVHLLERDGERVPLDRTEYARDGALAYSRQQAQPLGGGAQRRALRGCRRRLGSAGSPAGAGGPTRSRRRSAPPRSAGGRRS